MSEDKHNWTDEERMLVIELSENHTEPEIVYELVCRGYPQRTRGAVNGIIRRHKEGNKTRYKPSADNIKILYFDIETSDLSASFGEMLCFGYWWHSEPEPHVLKIHSYEGWDELPVERRDFYLLQDVVKIMEEADILVGHFSSGFDHPFIQTRCLVHGLPPIPTPVHIDTWRIAKRQLRLNNNRLKTLAKALGCTQQKSEVPINIWRRAKAHDIDAIEQIAEYNLQDVRTQRDVTEKLMPLAKKMPNWNLFVEGTRLRCPACGNLDLEHRGYAYTKLYKYNRLRCKDCGKWMRERNTITPRDTERVSH